MRKIRGVTGFAMVIVLAGLGLSSTPALCNEPVKSQPLFIERVLPTGIVWSPQVRNGGTVLTVSGPSGAVFQMEFGAGTIPSMSLLDEKGDRLPDGQFSYELRATPVIDPEVRKMLEDARDSEWRSMLVADLQGAGKLPGGSLVQSGNFRVLNGRILVPSGSEGTGAASLSASTSGTVRPLDQVILDDLIVDGSLCVGMDCVDGENFGFDTMRLKENNLRIHFEDTSASASYPSNDWRITVNDSSNGGANHFSIDDVDGQRTPFKIMAGAPNNSLYVSSSGRIGLNTSTPVTHLHMAYGDTPTVRLDQDGSSGWSPYVWDVAANETNFFIRDVTGGSKLPFRIQPGAPTDSLTVRSDGKVGIGTWFPAHDLDVLLKTTGLVQLANTTAPMTTKVARMVVRHYDDAEEPVYLFGAASTNTNNFVALGGGSTLGNAATQIDLFTASNPTTTVGTPRLTIIGNGNVGIGTQTPTNPLQMASGARVTAGGIWMNASSREYKQNIRTLRSEDALATLQGLNPVTFSYKASPEEHHVGFVAEEVPELVSEKDRKALSPMDIVAVLTKIVQEQQKTIATMREELNELKEKVR